MSRKALAIRFWLTAGPAEHCCKPAPRGAARLETSTIPPADVATVLSTATPLPTAQQTRTAQTGLAPTYLSPTRLPPPVTVTAINGNIFIRRGPDLAFNAISVLAKGETVVAVARDVLARWLQITVPGDPQRTGWITIVTSYTSVTGDVQGLPEVEQTIWPELASLRNCTHHMMRTDPGGIDIPAVDYFPENEVRINPGVYSILDLDVDKYPDVLRADIREGSAIDIMTDGTGEKKKCPVP